MNGQLVATHFVVSQANPSYIKEREGLANEPTSACPCEMQVRSSNVTFITTKYAYSLRTQIASCTQQD